MRYLSLIAVPAAAAVLLAGCGGSDSTQQAALGTPQHPMVGQSQGSSPAAPTADARKKAAAVAKTNEAAASGTAAAKPGTSAAPDGKPVDAPKPSAAGEPTAATSGTAAPDYESLLKQKSAPKGTSFSPCNLVSRKRAEVILGGAIQAPLEAPQGPTCIYRSTNGKSFVTVAVQQLRYAKVAKQVTKPVRLGVEGHAAYCGTLGREMLYLPLSGTRLLTIAAPCSVAKAFAATAVQKLVD
ncbi:MAG TPA: hypothetical protein VGM33_00285 [Baekduia sp.]|jgi:hypothetical protein